MTNIQGIFLTGSFKQDAIKASESAAQEYDRLHDEALFTPPIVQSPLPTTLSVTLLNTRSKKKHAADIASDWRLMNNDILFLTETQLSPGSDVNEIQTILDQFSISFNMSDYRFSSLAICYQKSVLLQCHQEDEGISVIKPCKPTYSNDCVSIAILYRRQLSTIPAFFSNLELLNNSSEINIVLGDFNLDALDPGLFEQISNTLSKFYLVNSNSTHLNGFLIDQVYVRKAFLDISHVNVSDFNMAFSDHDTVQVVFRPN